MSSIIETVHGAIESALREAIRLFSDPPSVHRNIVLAVSGGLDSVCLLDAVDEVSGKLSLIPIICHVDHRLRKASERDAQFVAAEVAARSLTFELRVASDRDERENLEAWARRIRYQFLESVREQSGALAVLTAHHQNDQAETFLLRMLSGRLATDARSIARISSARRLVRPMLDLSREQLEEYAAARGLSWITDETNCDLRRTRNRVRLELLPQLAANYNPRIVADTAELAARLGSDEHLLWEEAAKLATSPSSRLLSWLTQVQTPYRWRVLSLLAREDVGEDAGRLGYRKLELLSSTLGLFSRQSIGFGIDCEVHNGAVRFRAVEQHLPDSLPAEPLPVPGDVVRNYGAEGTVELLAELIDSFILGEIVARARLEQGDPELSARAFFDADKIAPEGLTVRQRGDGDTVRVFARGTRSVKKLFQERGVRLTLRNVIPIVEQVGAILWVPGVARSEHALIGADTKKVLSLSYFKRPNP